MNSNDCKNAILGYFRFQRGFPYVCTELYEADCIVSSSKVLYEIEVKISWSDYLADWKKSKHQKYILGTRRPYPHRFFFSAPRELSERISQDLVRRGSPYGVIAIDQNGAGACWCSVLRTGKPLPGKIDDGVREKIVARITSELVTLRRMLRKSV